MDQVSCAVDELKQLATGGSCLLSSPFVEPSTFGCRDWDDVGKGKLEDKVCQTSKS